MGDNSTSHTELHVRIVKVISIIVLNVVVCMNYSCFHHDI